MQFQTTIAIPNWTFFTTLSIFALVTSVISMLTLIYAIKLIGPTPTSILGAMEPVVAVAVSVALFNEQLTLFLIIGTIFIIAEVFLSILSDQKTSKS